MKTRAGARALQQIHEFLGSDRHLTLAEQQQLHAELAASDRADDLFAGHEPRDDVAPTEGQR